MRRLLGLLLLLSPWIFADDTPVPPRWTLGAELGFALSNRSLLPHGYETKHLTPPFSLTARYDLPLDPSSEHSESAIFRLIFAGNLSFAFPLGMPFLGLEGGAGLRLGDFDFEGLASIQVQSLMNETSQEVSPLDVNWYSIRVLASYLGHGWRPFLELEFMEVAKTRLSNFEGLETHSQFEPTVRTTAGMEVGLICGLYAQAAIDYFSVGRTAIASKEFATSLDPQTIFRYRLETGVRVSDFRFALMFRAVDRVEDVEALYVQAPFLYRNAILVPKSLSLEVQWKF